LTTVSPNLGETATRAIPVTAQMLCGLTFSEGLPWFSDGALQQISAVGPSTGDVVRVVPCPGVTTGLTTLRGKLLQVVGQEHSVRVIDSDRGSVLEQLPNPRSGRELLGIEAGPAGISMGYEDLRVLDLRSPDELELLDSIPVTAKSRESPSPASADHEAATISVVDPDTRVESTPIKVEGNPTGMTWDGTRSGPATSIACSYGPSRRRTCCDARTNNNTFCHQVATLASDARETVLQPVLRLGGSARCPR
jgi:hypothetical protein